MEKERHVQTLWLLILPPPQKCGKYETQKIQFRHPQEGCLNFLGTAGHHASLEPRLYVPDFDHGATVSRAKSFQALPPILTMVPPYHVPNPSRLYLRFFSKAARQNPERKAWVRGQHRAASVSGYKLFTKLGSLVLMAWEQCDNSCPICITLFMINYSLL